ncbi:MAG: iron ABC transporter permease [Chloroflexi bacterium]|nr:iron ABC transporter permease [Chloroflexota bacterium]
MDGDGAALRLRLQQAGAVPLRLLLFSPFAFLAVFYAYPVLTLFAISLAPAGQIDLGVLADLFDTSYYVNLLGFTFGQAALSTLLTLALALPSAYVFTRFDFPGKRLLLALGTLPFVLPTVVVAPAFAALIGESGLLNDLLVSLFGLSEAPIQLERTLAIILIVHVFYNYSIALRLIASFWSSQSASIEEAARVLGAHGWRMWWNVRLPMLRPAILAAALLVFIFCFTSFGVVLILGGPRFATLEVEIYRQATSLFNLPLAAALSMIQMAVIYLLMLIYAGIQRQVIVELRPEQTLRRPRRSVERIGVTANLVVMSLLLFAPLLALVVQAFTLGGGFTLRYFTALGNNPRGSVLFTPPAVAIGNSLVFAIVTIFLALLLGTLASYALRRGSASRWLDPLLMLPLATSAVTLGFGFIVALDEPPLNLRSSAALIPIAHTLVALPFVIRSVLPALRAIPPNVTDAARTLGAHGWTLWRAIELPLISRALIVGAVFSFTVSMGEFGASLFIARPDTPTLPVVIFRLLGQPGAMNYGQALALSVILMAVCSLAFVLIERFRTLGAGISDACRRFSGGISASRTDYQTLRRSRSAV